MVLRNYGFSVFVMYNGVLRMIIICSGDGGGILLVFLRGGFL